MSLFFLICNRQPIPAPKMKPGNYSRLRLNIKYDINSTILLFCRIWTFRISTTDFDIIISYNLLSLLLVVKSTNNDKRKFVFERKNKLYNGIIANKRAVWSLDYSARFLSCYVKKAERVLLCCRSPPSDFDLTTTNRNWRNYFWNKLTCCFVAGAMSMPFGSFSTPSRVAIYCRSFPALAKAGFP